MEHKNKFERLVHLVGFIIRIYHDAQSSECQKSVIVVAAYPQYAVGLCRSAHVADSVLLNSQADYIVIRNKTRRKACSIYTDVVCFL
jgi:hypothetical protein